VALVQERAAAVTPGPCVTNETMQCQCSSAATGRQICVAGVWGRLRLRNSRARGGGSGNGGPAVESCGQQARGFDVGLDRNRRRQAVAVLVTMRGSFSGSYASSLTFVGAAIPVFSLDASGMPGLEFNLDQGAGGGEVLTVSGGQDARNGRRRVPPSSSTSSASSTAPPRSSTRS